MKTNEHGSTQNLRKLGLAFSALSAASLFVLTGTAGAQGTAQPVTDYASYPAPLPALCPQGGGALEGLRFDNGRSDIAPALHELDVRHGDTVTMSWTGFHAGCLAADGTPAITVGLAAYDNPTLRFDASVDERLADWTACGVDGEPCTKTGDRYTLSLTLPGPEICNLQLDAHLGLPLAVVGPNGSFYSGALRGHGTNRLISAANFGLEPCVPPSTPTTVAAPTVTAPPETPTTEAPPAPPQESPTTEAPAAPEAPATPTTEAPVAPEAPATPTTVMAPLAPASPPSTAPSTTIAQTRVLSETVTAPARSGELPFTGSDTFGMLRIATWLATAGVGTILAGTVLRHRRQNA